MRSTMVDVVSQPVVNLCSNPSFELDTSNTWWNGSSGGPSHQRAGGLFGSSFWRVTQGFVGVQDSFGPYQENIAAVEGRTYTGSLWVRCSIAAKYRLTLEHKNAAGNVLAAASSALTTLTANVWTRLSVTTTAVAGTTRFTITCYSGGSQSWAGGETVDIDGLMVTDGTALFPYADGDMPGWKWLGTPGASASVGYPWGPELLRNQLTRAHWLVPDIGGQTGWQTSASATNGTATVVTDPIPGTAVSQVVKWSQVADAVRAWSTLTCPHGLPIKTGEIWTFSAYVRRVSGLAAPSISMQLIRPDAQNNVSNSLVFTPGDTWQRYSKTFTALADSQNVTGNRSSSNSFYFSAANPATNQGAFEIEVGGFQIEREDGLTKPFIPPYN